MIKISKNIELVHEACIPSSIHNPTLTQCLALTVEVVQPMVAQITQFLKYDHPFVQLLIKYNNDEVHIELMQY